MEGNITPSTSLIDQIGRCLDTVNGHRYRIFGCFSSPH